MPEITTRHLNLSDWSGDTMTVEFTVLQGTHRHPSVVSFDFYGYTFIASRQDYEIDGNGMGGLIDLSEWVVVSPSWQDPIVKASDYLCDAWIAWQPDQDGDGVSRQHPDPLVAIVQVLANII